MFDSITTTAMTTALAGLAQRQRAIADNIANVNTPGYLAKRVSFEDSLATSVARGSGTADISVQQSLEPTRTNGNNVNMDTETLSNIETVLRYQFAARAVESEFTSARTAMRTH
ncbi:MAG: flagellar biosynthesis protein FlgB [Naasia sp.]|nr:flagellar biosynthesis protein FlgB [Naasia sp.]